MEQQLLDIFPDENVPVRNYSSFINQPERIQISSQEDINDYDQNTLTTYFNFRVPLPRPAINVKSLQLARANIPNAVASFPDTELTFWYYAIPFASEGTIKANNGGVPGATIRTFNISGDVFNAGIRVPGEQIFFDGSGDTITGDLSGLIFINGNYFTYPLFTAIVGAPGDVPVYNSAGVLSFFLNYNNPRIDFENPSVQLNKPNYLRYFRLLPSFVPPELYLDIDEDQIYGFNRIFDDADDLNNELGFSVVNDLLFGAVIPNPPGPPIRPNNIPGTFRFVKGLVDIEYNNTFKKFLLNLPGGENFEVEDIFSIMPCASDDPNWFAAAKVLAERDLLNSGQVGFFGVETAIQPFVEYRNLNLRLGFNYATYPVRLSDLKNMIRPHPSLVGQSLTSGRDFTSNDLVAPGYADLVNTSCVHIYTDITGGSTVDSIVNKALLGSIPMNTTPLGVGFHSLPLNNPLTKIPTQINEIYIEMRNDSGQPFYIGNNAVVSLELILTY
jgi:hypothetical protein